MTPAAHHQDMDTAALKTPTMPAQVLGDGDQPVHLTAIRGWVSARAKTGGTLAGSYLALVDLSGLDLPGANLVYADLWGANLKGADLPGANLTGADLRHARLDGAHLPGARLDAANLAGARLDGANLTGVVWDAQTVWPEGFVPPAPPEQVVHDDAA